MERPETIPAMSNWKAVTLGEVAELRRERMSVGSTLRYVGLEHVEAHTNRLLGFSSAMKIKSSVQIFRPGDVLYSKMRPYLNKVVRPDFSGVASSEFLVFKETPLISSEFLMYRLSAPDFHQFAMDLAVGDRPRVRYDALRSFQFMLPPIKEQHRIAKRLSSAWSNIAQGMENLIAAREKCFAYERAFLSAAVTGQLTADWRRTHIGDSEGEDRVAIQRHRRKVKISLKGEQNTSSRFRLNGKYSVLRNLATFQRG